MPNRPKILTVKMKSEDSDTFVVFELGTMEIVKKIPTGHGLVRASAILSDTGDLVDAELITIKQ
jgi:hypothetical protein